MTIKIGEIGKVLNVNAAFDMSNNSELQLIFKTPEGNYKTVASDEGVTAPAIDFTDPETGQVFKANEYWSYPCQDGVFDVAGNWQVTGIYEDSTPKKYIGDTASFTVLPTS